MRHDVTDFPEIYRIPYGPASLLPVGMLSRGQIFGFQNGSRNNRISAQRSDRLGPCFGTLLGNFFEIFEKPNNYVGEDRILKFVY